MNKLLRSKFVIAGSVTIITLLIFFPTLQNDFVNWDDDEYISNNPFIRSIDIKLFKSAFMSFYSANWHPLTWISHAIDYSIWGLNPVGHHLTSIILHSLNTFLVVFLVMRLMTANRGLSESFMDGPAIFITGTVVGLLFGIHPLHVESVAWVAERKDLLSGLFFLLSIMMYIEYVSKESCPEHSFLKRQYLLALGFFALALLSKPMAISLPFVLLLLDWYPFRRIRSLQSFRVLVIEKGPFIALSIISATLTILAQKAARAVVLLEVIPLSERMLVASKSLITYLCKIIVPIELVPYYPYPKNASLFSLEFFSSIVLVIGITIFCIVVARRNKLWLSAWSYFVITLLPVLGIVQVGNESMADRYTYLPSLGPFFILGLIVPIIYERLATSKIMKMVSYIVAAAVVFSLSYTTMQQIARWKNSITLWNYVIEKEPGRVPLAYNNVGAALFEKGEIDKAIEQYRIAISLVYNYPKAHNNLGVAYAVKGALNKAGEEFQIALNQEPNYGDAHFNLGLAYLSFGAVDMARGEFESALRLNPDDYRARKMINDGIKTRH